MYKSDVYLEEKRLIQSAANRDRLVIFVGAGTSIPSGMPSWKEAIEKILEHLGYPIGDEDFLKIPQYYYNEHGKNNYVDLMRRIFKYGNNLYPRAVHHKILKFRTKYVITTNYDHLLEQALTDENQVFDVISHDKELAYGTADRKIIKMHGDFEHDNFVLKEDDYLHYSHSFRLLETYIKALIAGNVVLFLGYSFSDPDLKQIFTWVKEIIGNDRPQSYIVDIGKECSVAKTNYFKNFGIKILYASEKLNCFDSDKMEENLESMIDFLQSKSEENSEEKLDMLYKALSPFMSLNYVYSKYIIEAFAKCGIRLDFSTQTLSNYILKANVDESKEVDDLLSELCIASEDINKITDVKRQKKLSRIFEILDKSMFKKLFFEISDNEGNHYEKKIIEVPDSRDSVVNEICDAILNYDVETLRKLKEKNSTRLDDVKPQFYFRQAFIEYLLSDYVAAYENFQKATLSYYRNGIQEWYFLTMLNRKLLSGIVSRYALGKAENEKITNDFDELDLDQTFQNLQKSGRNRNEYLKDLYTLHIFYKYFQEVYKNALKVKEEANTSYWIYSGSPRFQTLNLQVRDLWHYIIGNFLLFDRYDDCANIFEVYGRNILESVMSPDIESDRRFNFMEGISNIRPESLKIFDLYVVTRYLPMKDIESVVLKSKRKFIPFDSKGIEYLKTIIPNLKFWDRFVYGELFWKIVYIVSHIELDKDLISIVIEELESHEKYHSPYDVAMNWNRIATLFQSVISQDVDFPEGNEELSVTLKNFLEFVLKNFKSITSEGRRGKQNIQSVLYTGIKLHNEIQGEKFSDDEIKKMVCAEHLETLAIIYPLLDDDCQSKIEEVVRSNHWEVNNDSFYNIYLLAQNKIISIDDELEKNILTYINNLEDDRKTTSPSRYELALQCVTNLYTGGLLRNGGNFVPFIQKSGDEFWKFIIDVQNFDMSNFQLNWLNYFSKGFLGELQKDKAVVQTIRQQVTKKYLDGWIDDNIMRRYFEFFSCDTKIE